MKTLRLRQMRINGGFWDRYLKLLQEVIIPYQFKILTSDINGSPSNAVNNFRIASGDVTGDFAGQIFQDSDVYKWLEAVGYTLQWSFCPRLKDQADRIIDYLEKAQQPDGYLNTYYIINGLENRFTNLMNNHELYCLGHLIEAAIAYCEGTGDSRLIRIACRYADLVDATFGSEDWKVHGYPGHQEIELALIKLWEFTGEKRYGKLAKYFLDERGQSPNYFLEEHKKRNSKQFWNDPIPDKLSYNQSHCHVREQTEAVGHAVRALYMYTAMAMMAQKTQDQSLADASRRLWDDVVNRQLYITGGVGQTAIGESFTLGYDLPNNTSYSETCASIGLVFFAQSMFELEAKSEYADIIERVLYNLVLASVAMDGKHYFYANPQSLWCEASDKSSDYSHIKKQRLSWFACACCPTNVARTLASLGKYVFQQERDVIYVNLYATGNADFTIEDGSVSLSQETGYPFEGDVAVSIRADQDCRFTLALRIPGWCKSYEVWVNGQPAKHGMKNGYVCLDRGWHNGDTVHFHMDMPVRMVSANPAVRENIGKVAVTRGPLVYCMEEQDNGPDLHLLHLADTHSFRLQHEPDLLGGIIVIDAYGQAIKLENQRQVGLYEEYKPEVREERTIRFIPYYAWANRNEGDMSIWINIT